jgi:GalNAc-alpha-(1->4)-GalNAc-alpha-(1->3)-diNAcBac-PP-undecaprenol alpha-1,4-N-acetyl-D-galactosaminyltransferase
VQLITFWDTGSDFYDISPKVRRVSLSLWRPTRELRQSLWITLHRIRAVRAQVRARRPDVVISMMDTTNILTLLATIGLRVPVIVSERIHPAMHRIGPFREWMRRCVYPLADLIVVVSPQIREWMETNVRRDRVVFVPNPVTPIKPSSTPPRSFGLERKVVGMGRLASQKGFDLLLQAFAPCCRSHPGWTLDILGDGPERASLEALALRLGISSCTRFLGLVRDPGTVLSQGDLFVLSSRYEGFPNALVEAMSCGLPAVSFDCPSGPKDIIRDGVDGILVPPQDVEGLSAAIDRLMSNDAERHSLASRAIEVNERFGVERVAKIWEDLIPDVMAGRATGTLP